MARAALASRGDAPAADVAPGLRAAAVFAMVEGDLDEAERLAGESISIARGAGDRLLELHSLGSLANIVQMRGEFARAADLLAEVEAFGRATGRPHVAAVANANRAYLALQTGELDRAFALAREALDSSRAIGDSTNAVTAGLNLALAADALGDVRAARDALLEAIEVAQAIGHRPFLVDGLIVAAAVVAGSDPRTAAGLLAAVDRARLELTIELGPVERDLAASVADRLREQGVSSEPDAVATDELDAMLDREAASARRALAVVG